MTIKIWKFALVITDEQIVEMPAEGKILYVNMQANTLNLWAQVNTEAERTVRTIRIFGTGNPMPDDPGRYIGTFMLKSDALVFHAYESP